MPEVPKKRTPIAIDQLPARIGQVAPDLTAQQRAMLAAHIAIETASGQSLFNHNFGNISSAGTSSVQHDFWRPPWYSPPGPDASERIKKLHQLMKDKKEPSAFRSYPTAAAGLSDYLSRMRGRFSPMLNAPTPADFVREWRDTGYTPRLNVEDTTRTFLPLVSRFGGVGDNFAPDPLARSGNVGKALMAVGLGGLLLWRLTR